MRESLERRRDIELDVIDVREAGLPAYDLPSPPALAQRQYVDDAHRDLGERLDAADAYLLITHEFNHGHSALQKNLLDHYFIELEHKPVAFVGYGNVSGARAIEQPRLVVAELNLEKGAPDSPVAIFGRYLSFLRRRPCLISRRAATEWVLTTPDTLIEARAVPSAHSA